MKLCAIASLAFGLVLIGPGAAEAVKCGDRAPAVAEPTDADDAFGFIDGSGLSSPCEIDIQKEMTARWGKRDGTYRGVNAKLEATWLLAPRWQASFALWQAYHGIRNNTVPGYPNQNRHAFDGLHVQVAYQFRERGERVFDPGFSVGVEFRWGRLSESEALSAERFAVTLKGAIDMAVHSDRLYAGINFNLGPGTERLRFGQGYVNDSGVELGAALTYRLRDGGRTFVGFNARYLAAYSGAFFNRRQGEAIFLGPTLFHEFGDIGPLRSVFLSIAWTPQVWGQDAGGILGGLDLVNFERHQFRLRIGGTL